MEFCPVNVFELYISKRNKKTDFLWQRPKKKVHYTDKEWYDSGRVGHDPLERFMKFLTKDAALIIKDYTNHSIRATVITNLNEFGYEARHIIAVTGHKSESTVKQYAKKCPESKKREMNESLASKLQPKKVKVTDKQDFDATVQFEKKPNIASAAISVPTKNPDPDTSTDFADKNFQILPMDDTDDDLLMKVLDEFDKQSNPTNTQVVTNNVQTINTSVMHNQKYPYPNTMPQMYFPNSTVTINYNFNSQ